MARSARSRWRGRNATARSRSRSIGACGMRRTARRRRFCSRAYRSLQAGCCASTMRANWANCPPLAPHVVEESDMADAERKLSDGRTRIEFETDPSRYRHWKLKIDGDVATLLMDVDEKGTLFEGYELKLNSYDLGVDIELADAIERLRFEHPQVKVILLRSGKPRVFCAGANIRMLAGATNAHQVNLCKFTNETRNGIEDASEASGLFTICVINGTAAGGGYELALAADHIMLIDDGSSAVSLPELPLLAVLPGTGGLTRVTDKRKVRRD